MTNDLARCPWCGTDPLYVDYHDREWGVPQHDPRALWEMLVLEGFQAGLSWITILRKRDGFRAAFDGMDPGLIAAYGAADIERLVADARIVRHRGKIEGAVKSARAYLEIEAKGSFHDLIWNSVGGVPVQNRLTGMGDAQSETEASRQLSKTLKKAGFAFCGPTTVYAFMQAAGLVNDHLTLCHRHAELGGRA